MLTIALISDLPDSIKSLLNLIFKVWNYLITNTYEYLQQLPGDIDGVQSILEAVNVIFVGVGASLVVLFFIIGFCQETVNVRDEMRMDSIFMYLTRLCMAEYFTVNSMTILNSILTCCKTFCEVLENYFKSGDAKLKIAEADLAIIEDMGFWESLVVLLLVFLIGCLLIIMGASIWYTAFSRILKITILIPFGSLAFSTMAGAGEVGRVCTSYVKYFLIVAFEAVAISVALIFGTAIIQYVALDFGLDGTMKVIGHLIAMLFQAAILAGTVKGAEQFMRNVIGY